MHTVFLDLVGKKVDQSVKKVVHIEVLLRNRLELRMNFPNGNDLACRILV